MERCSKLKMPIPGYSALSLTIMIKAYLIQSFISIKIQIVTVKKQTPGNLPGARVLPQKIACY
jgi:hypothetical protein